MTRSSQTHLQHTTHDRGRGAEKKLVAAAHWVRSCQSRHRAQHHTYCVGSVLLCANPSHISLIHLCETRSSPKHASTLIMCQQPHQTTLQHSIAINSPQTCSETAHAAKLAVGSHPWSYHCKANRHHSPVPLHPPLQADHGRCWQPQGQVLSPAPESPPGVTLPGCCRAIPESYPVTVHLVQGQQQRIGCCKSTKQQQQASLH